ncbi:Nucleic acid-binding OB-fold-like protein [Euphorbia peplus]|nr:Nucleic acid-binding OB-fold-like protein [Euphorbia peplus]
MDGLTLATTATTSTTALYPSKSLFSPVSIGVRRLGFRRKSKFVVFAAQDEPKFDQWDQMELKFGRMLGEDPKLTLAKIMAKKANPDVSFLEVEKQFYKNKGKVVEIKELPFDVPNKNKKQPSSNSLDGLGLVRPVPKGGFEFPNDIKPVAPGIRKPSRPLAKPIDNSSTKRSVPNVILRKPALYVEDDVEDMPSRSRVNIKPNLTLKMRDYRTYDKFSDMTLLRKPQPSTLDNEDAKDSDANGFKAGNGEGEDKYSGFTLLRRPETTKSGDDEDASETDQSSAFKVEESEDVIRLGMQPLEESQIESRKEQSDVDSVDSVDAALQGRPKRLDNSVKETSASDNKETTSADPERGYCDELMNLPPTSPVEDADWSRAEDLLRTGNRADVELVSASPRGFIVSFGSLVGFLPYRNLAAKWKFLAFESWLKQKGLDPSLYKQNIGIIGSLEISDQNFSVDSSVNSDGNQNVGEEVTPDMKLEDLLRIYDQEKLKFLSSFVGQKIKANIIVADKKTRKFIVSLRAREKEESVQKKRNLMTRLQIGDIVKCCIKKITYFGIFVEVEEVPALIHQTEVSWDAALDPASYFKVGQIVEAKVHHLDFMLERISLSLKEIMPDPLTEALESVVGDHDSLDGRLQAAEADSEWPDVESLIEELQKIEGVQCVSKGRFFLSPGLAPTFQVYMASMFENQYKLLARAGNKVQEVIVEASLEKEEMKSTILSCTNRVS